MKTEKNVRSPERTTKTGVNQPAKQTIHRGKQSPVPNGQLVFFDIGIDGCRLLSLPESPESIESIVRSNEPLVKYWLNHTRGISSLNEDDVYQAGMIGLWNAARKFDPEKGAAFGTYASVLIRRSMYMEIQKEEKKANQDRSIEDITVPPAPLIVSEEKSFTSDGSKIFRIMMDVADTLSSIKEKKAVQSLVMYLQGYSKDEIASALKVNAKSYTALISMGRKVLQRHPLFLQNTDVFRNTCLREYAVDLLGSPFKLRYAQNPIFDFPVKSNERLEESLCRTLANEEVADYILNEVRIGDPICIFNTDVGYTAVMIVYEDSLEITFVVQSKKKARQKVA